MNRLARHSRLCFPAGLALVLALAACTPGQADSQISGRPACVTLSSYSGVIQQVMGIQAVWDPIVQEAGELKSRWAIQDDKGNHTLSVTMALDGCIFATNATSNFSGGLGQGELAGLLQGAAVAPVSNLDYTGSWLEPRILLRCPFAFIMRNSYEAQKSMPDGTTWKLTCSGNRSAGNGELATSLSVTSPTSTSPLD